MNKAQQVQVLEANKDHNHVTIQRPGFRSSTLLTRTINLPQGRTPGDFLASLQQWRQGAVIQDAFPWLPVDEREFMISGLTPQMWDALMS